MVYAAFEKDKVKHEALKRQIESVREKHMPITEL